MIPGVLEYGDALWRGCARIPRGGHASEDGENGKVGC